MRRPLATLRRELRETWRSLLGWTIGVAGVLFMYLPLFPSIGGGGQTFSASPVAAGNHLFFLNEDGETFVLEGGDTYKEVARNDLDEMSLASPAIAGDALYIRTRTKLYKIAQ